MSFRLHLVWTLMIQWCSTVTIFGIFANSGNYLYFLWSSGMVQSFVRFSRQTIMIFVCIFFVIFRKERVQWWTLRRPFLMPYRSRKTWRNWTNSGTTATIPLLPNFHAYLSLSLSPFLCSISLCLFLSLVLTTTCFVVQRFHEVWPGHLPVQGHQDSTEGCHTYTLSSKKAIVALTNVPVWPTIVPSTIYFYNSTHNCYGVYDSR